MCFLSVICVRAFMLSQSLVIKEGCVQTMQVHINHKHAYCARTNAKTHTTCARTHVHTRSSLWCPAPVWPSAGMWSEAGNVWAMKACVYAGCSHPSPARGKTDTSAASFALHLLLLLQTLNVIFSHLQVSKISSFAPVPTSFLSFSFSLSFFHFHHWQLSHNTGTNHNTNNNIATCLKQDDSLDNSAV